ncbi:uncharacterized protein CBL_11724 [Carabus blaptoides fortunei]
MGASSVVCSNLIASIIVSFNMRMLRPPPVPMPHPNESNMTSWNNFGPPANQPTSNAGYPPYPVGAMNGPPMIRAPNPTNANLGYPTPAGTRHPPYYQNPPPVYAPDMRSQYNIQISMPNTDDPIVREVTPGTFQEESSDATEENEEFVHEKCDVRLRKWIIARGHPFSMIANKEFVEFMNDVNPSYKLPTVEDMKSDLCADYLKFSEKVRQQLLLDSVSVCITAESLISKNNCQYVAMTAHYIDKQYKKRSILFDCSEMLRYDRTAIVFVIDMALEKFGLTGRVITFVSDNNVLVKEMFADKHNWNYFGCYGLELKEVADGLKQVAIQFLTDHCPTIRVGSNWYLQDIIETVSKVLPTLSNFIEEYNICVDIIKVLEPFEELIRFIGNQYIWTSEFMLINRSLLSAYEKLMNENLSEDIKKAVQTVLEKLTKLAEHEYIQSLAYATFLDPRYKNTVSTNSDEDLSIKETFIEEVASLCRPKWVMQVINGTGNPMVPDNNHLAEIASIFSAFDKRIMESQIPVRTARDEVNRYIDAVPLRRHEDPLKWWADHTHLFPHLSKMAVTYLNMQITSVPFDQIFTNAGKARKEKLNNYDTECVPMITFLSANLQFMDRVLNQL